MQRRFGCLRKRVSELLKVGCIPEILQLLSEVRWEKFKLALLNTVVNSVLFFLVAQFALGFIGVPYYATIILSIPVFLWNLSHYMKKYSFKYIEEKNPAIDELLR